MANVPSLTSLPGTFRQLGRGWVGGCTQCVHGRSGVDHRPSHAYNDRRSTSGFHRPGRHGVHLTRSAVSRPVIHRKGELHPTKSHL